MKIRIATRKSELALWQANSVAKLLRQLPQAPEVTLVPLSTRGDEVLDRSLQKIGGKGLFIKELEIAMHTGDADMAVHSMKDVPAEMPQGFCIAAVLERANPADALVSADGCRFSELPEGAGVGSSSLRRQAQLLAMRPDLCISPLRGNVATRLDKLDRGDYQAIVLACAGLERLGLAARISQQFSPLEMLPAAGQGIIGIECLESRSELRDLLAGLEHPQTRTAITAERAVAVTLGADCQSPVASFATISGDELTIDALAASADGSRIIRERSAGPAGDAEAVGRDVAARLLRRGAGELLGGAPG